MEVVLVFFIAFKVISFMEKKKGLYISQISISCHYKISLTHQSKIFLSINLTAHLTHISSGRARRL